MYLSLDPAWLLENGMVPLMVNYKELTYSNLELVVQMLLAFPSALKLTFREWTGVKGCRLIKS